MPKPTIVKCRECKTEIDKENAYKIGKASYYCNENCYNKMQNKKVKPTVESKPSDLRLLTDFILKIYIDNGVDKDTINWGLITKQISNIIKENPTWNYKAMKYVLNYYYNICENEFNIDFGLVWAIERYYLEAKQFCVENLKRKKSVQNCSFNNNEIIIKANGNKLTETKYKEIDFE